MAICKEFPLRITKLTVNGEPLDIEHYLKKTYPDVTEALVELPSIIEWLNMGHQQWTEWLEREEFNYKHVQAKAYFELKSGTFAQQYGEKMTEAALEKAVIIDDAVVKCNQVVAECKGWVTRYRNTIETFRLKFELIRTVEATRRHIDQGVAARGQDDGSVSHRDKTKNSSDYGHVERDL